jgi:undecaprenyl diphosphate synthase
MLLAQEYANHELPELQRNNIRLQLMGRRDELPDAVLRALDNTIQQTQTNTRMVLNIALNYGGRTEIVDATKAILSDYQVGRISPEEINEDTLTSYMYCPQCPDVDLIIRTGGEWRLSNFLLWRASRAIFVTQSILWPDFKKKDLLAAVKVYQEQSLRRGQSG